MDALTSLSPSQRELLWGSIPATDTNQKQSNFQQYKYVELIVTYPNAGRTTKLIPCAPLAYASQQAYHITNGEPQNTNYYGILSVSVSNTYIQITGSQKGSGVGVIKLDIYGIK